MSKNDSTENIEMTEDQKKEIIRTYEDDILGGLLKAANFRDDPDEIVPIEIARGGIVLFTFHIHPLSEEEFMSCRKACTSYAKNRTTGVKVAESVDGARYKAMCIYNATTDEDRERMWDNKTLWSKLSVFNGTDALAAVLKGGEKSAVYDKLEEISAYNLDLDEKVKN